jgi:hypothetical protein
VVLMVAARLTPITVLTEEVHLAVYAVAAVALASPTQRLNAGNTTRT